MEERDSEGKRRRREGRGGWRKGGSEEEKGMGEVKEEGGGSEDTGDLDSGLPLSLLIELSNAGASLCSHHLQTAWRRRHCGAGRHWRTRGGKLGV